MKIILVRHGESTENVANMSGDKYNVSDIILTNNGITQSVKTAHHLKLYGNFDAVYSSPLQRSIQTSHILSSELGLCPDDVVIDSALTEIDANAVTNGMSSQEQRAFFENNKQITELDAKLNAETNLFKVVEINTKIMNIAYDYMQANDLLFTQRKIKAFLHKLKKSNHKQILIVTHGGVIKFIIGIITNTSICNELIHFKLNSKYDKPSNTKISNCSLTGLLFDGKKYQLIFPTNTAHLA